MMSRVKRFFKKYGAGGGFFVMHWKMQRIKFWLVAMFLKMCKLSSFEIVEKKIDNEIYFSEISSDFEQIFSGNRAILSGTVDDEIRYDVKYGWEKSRHQELFVASMIGRIEGDRLLEKTIKEINNPSFFKNKNAMEISIAGINVLVALQNRFSCLDFDSKEQARQFIKETLVYIFKNIEFGIRYSNNHLFFDLIGVIWILQNINGNFYIHSLVKKVKRVLIKLLAKIIEVEGNLYEGSTCYHKYVTESLLEYLYFNEDKNEKILNNASKMVEFCYRVSIANSIIDIGDNDTGRILPLGTYFHYKSLDLSVIRMLSEKLSLKVLTDNRKVDLLNSFGIIRIQDNSWTFFLRCDQINDKEKNKVIGNHYHNDQLSLILYVYTEPLLIDTGTFSYTNEFRASNMTTSRHNTLIFENQEQTKLPEGFKYFERKNKAVFDCIEEKKCIVHHLGYFPIIHQREVKIDGTDVIINDKLLGLGSKKTTSSKVHFWLDPSCLIRNVSHDSIFIKKGKLSIKFTTSGFITVKKDYIYPEYAKKVTTNVICVDMSGDKVVSRFSLI